MMINATKNGLAVIGLLISSLAIANVAHGAEFTDTQPLIAIIIDDLGNQKEPGQRVIALPGPVVCSLMPHTAYARFLAEAAYAAGKEVMLHLPMQPVEMGLHAVPGEINLDTSQSNMRQILTTDLNAVPHTVGVNNHMGSLITRHPGHMEWLMNELSRRGNLYFIDSYTTASSIAFEMALENGVPTARRNVFLDNEKSASSIAIAFAQLKKEAKEDGFAIAIGHPYTVTLDYLEKEIPLLAEQGFRLVPVSKIMEFQEQRSVESKTDSLTYQSSLVKLTNEQY
ncbi:MAG: divergent polysaccharide deacetylase family protein [Gammaproteobacteria bacterium]|nr:divergent polysaccharide deacetylase family protein [Gammaproteobacteria bacterium]MCP4830789.1 divergent polysaccharide deacetylase family protein [Gammaproteobacteria bacterium]MCP4929578.1 divergent polysaccharide deacetylase family protein [Gammaproteobacteria bacterium]